MAYFDVTNHFLIFLCETDEEKRSRLVERIKHLQTAVPSSELSPGLWHISITDRKPVYMGNIRDMLSDNGKLRLLILRITPDIGLNWCLNKEGAQELTKIIENPYD